MVMWAFLIFALLILVDKAVRGESVEIVISFTDFVNVTASNGSLQVVADNATYTYSLSNVSQTLVFPVVVSEVRPFFNVSINNTVPNCAELLNTTLANQTAEFERIVREQLVPSNEQYLTLEREKNNLTAQCVVEKNILSNDILNYKVLLNASAINFNATATLLVERVDKIRGELKTSNIVAILLGVLTFTLAMIIITGRLPPQWWDEFIHQTPGGTVRGSLDVTKGGSGKGGAA